MHVHPQVQAICIQSSSMYALVSCHALDMDLIASCPGMADPRRPRVDQKAGELPDLKADRGQIARMETAVARS
jgi:hypothetical protein